MTTLIERLNNDDRFAKLIGAHLTEIREGYARAELTVMEHHLNGAGVCQGGVMFTLADLTFAAMANSHGILTVGISNNITFIKAGMLGDTLIAECTEQVNHQKLPYCDMTVKNQKGDILAMMTGLAYRLKKDFPYEGLM